MNLVKDMEALRWDEVNQMISEGFQFPSKEDIQTLERQKRDDENYELSDEEYRSILITYLYNWYSKIPSPTPRKILKCKNFVCPESRQAGLDMIEEEIKNGACLKRRLSRKIYDPAYKDDMMFDFGICHLHLGTTMDRHHPSLIQGGREILYLFFTRDTAVFIKIDEHGLWNDRDLLKELNDSFPDVLEPYKSRLESVDDYTDDERAEKKNENINTSLKIDGQTFMPPGGGTMINGTSRKSTEFLMCEQKKLCEIQDKITSCIKNNNLEEKIFNGQEQLKMIFCDLNQKKVKLRDDMNRVICVYFNGQLDFKKYE